MPIRIATWCALLMIIFLSVVPEDLRPHVLADKHIEHFAAYFTTGWHFYLGVSAAAAAIPGLRPAECVRGRTGGRRHGTS
jgi:hypothetical protein